MSDPVVRPEGAPPLPILGEDTLDQGGEIERTWKNAPSIVRDARLLAVLGIGFYATFFIVEVAQAVVAMTGENISRHSERGAGVIEGIGGAALYVALIVLNIWLIESFRLGRRLAWTIEMIFAIIGLVGFPIGTIISVYILVKWFQAKTKRWFGVAA